MDTDNETKINPVRDDQILTDEILTSIKQGV